jgi:uncharacterized protein
VYTIQTNGTLLDSEWAAFFKEHDFLVGISIDGPRDMHDAYRVNKGGKGPFEQVMRGLALLQEHGVEFKFFHHVDAPMRLMADWLRRGRAPAEILEVYRREEAAT